MLVMALTFGMMVIGCDNNGNGNGAASLVGTWRYESNDIVATFILSGNGTFRVYQDDDVLVGMWSTSNSFLSISFFYEDAHVQRGAIFSISGNRLTLDWGGGEIETWIRQS
jgi:predicted transcriptional regulator